MSNFKIDFWELMFLAEVCIPPVPIARGSFWDDLINVHYNEMSKDERKHAFNWITKMDSFNKENENCQRFFARFNPENQFVATCFHEGKVQKVECYRFNEKYWTSKTRFINPEYITKIEEL